jgi:K+-transporting ATPase ATPase C chain
VGYNAASSGGSNKGPTNPEYLAVVQCRIDTFLKHNPTVKRSDIPSDLVTVSASGIDPHLSIKAANVQVMRIAHARSIPAVELKRLIAKNTEHPLLGIFGPEQINVLKLNLELDRWQSKKMKHSAQL